MTRLQFAWFAAYSWWQLARFDIGRCLVTRSAFDVGEATTPAVDSQHPELMRDICDAFAFACCLYWKPVLCLQRSVCLTRILRSHGTRARLVIGYRTCPFLSHAWVEVDGTVVNDSAVYRERLHILHTS
jgi:hypothetical protein